MLPELIINVYCHDCGKVCSSFIRPISKDKAKQLINEWLQCPYCADCCIERMSKRKNETINE